MELLSVNVGLPRPVTTRRREVETGIFKYPVNERIMLRSLNLDGDGQADLQNHGGPFRAAYCYTFENYEHWRDTLDMDSLVYGNFGENFTVTEMPEDQICVGDIFRIGDAEVQVTQPRPPCYKLGIRMGRPWFPKQFLASGRVGFYLRVLREGVVGAGDKIELLEQHPERISVRRLINLLYFERDNREASLSASNLEALTPLWRELFAKQATGEQDYVSG